MTSRVPLVVLLVLSVQCTVTQTGNPPARPMLEREALVPTPIDQDRWMLHGMAGAVDPPAGIVRVTNIDSMAAPFDGAVDSDGSFALEVSASMFNELRIQVVANEQRSEPLDVTYEGATLPLVSRGLEDCLTIDLGPWFDFGRIDGAQESVLSLENGCGTLVRFDTPTLRRAPINATIDLEALAPLDLLPDNSVGVTVRLIPTGPGDIEEVVILNMVDLGAAQATRRPITFTAIGQ